MKRILFCAALGAAMLQTGPTAQAADVKGATATLQSLAVRIKQASDTVAAQRTTAADLAAFEHALHAFDATVRAEPESALAQKYRATALLLSKLAFELAQPAGTVAARPQTALDRQTLGARHGMSCATALGIAPDLPVEFALSTAGSGGSDAWLRIEPDHAGNLLFATDSHGADPAIAVYHGCGDDAPTARNDDALGLDAQVAVAAEAGTPLLLHVTNSGAGGAVRVSVATADSTISGRVLEANTNQPLANANIAVFDKYGNWSYGNSAVTDTSGNYAMPVAAGQYYVRAIANQHLVAVYPSASCPVTNYYSYNVSNCDLVHATLVTASTGTTTSGINFSLSVGQRIVGTVRDQNSQPVGNIQLALSDSSGYTLLGAQADAYGRYEFDTLPNGTYKLTASGGYNSNGYGSQMYNHVTCAGPLLTQCDLTKATPLTINGTDLLGIDFNVQQLASIHGTVSGAPGGYYTQVNVLSLGGATIASSYVDSTGKYNVGPLPIGTYYVDVIASGYFSRLYPNIDCNADCTSSLASGTTFTISQQGQSPQADFTLTPLPVQHGHVQDAVSGLPLQGVQVLLSATPPASFYAAGSATTDTNGNFAMTAPGPGVYYAWAISADHIDQVYAGIPCEDPAYYYPTPVRCDVTGASVITVNAATPTLADLNFALQPSSQISGHVYVRAGPGEAIPASSITVAVYDTSGAQTDSTSIDALGHYVLSDLAPGTYYVSAGSYYYNSNYLSQVWQNVDCTNNACTPTLGAPVVVGANASVSGIDFSLVRRDVIVGRVSDSNNAPIAGVLIDLFDATSLAYVATAATDAQGEYMVTGQMGSAYFVGTEAPGGYINQIYSGVTCPSGPAYQKVCPFTNATVVPLPYGSTQPHQIDFTLSLPPDEIFAGTFE